MNKNEENEVIQKKNSSFIFWEQFINRNKVLVVALVVKISKHWLSLIKKNQSTYQTRIFLDDIVKSKYFIIKSVQQDKFAREFSKSTYAKKIVNLSNFAKKMQCDAGCKPEISSLGCSTQIGNFWALE